MSNYFSQFIPHLGPTDQDFLLTNTDDSIPQLKYLAIYNPSISSDDNDSDLYQQILCFITPNEIPERKEQLRIIGLIRGIDYFAQNFNCKNEGTSVIKSSKSSIIKIKLEEDYYLTLCVSYPDSNRVDVINEQLIQLVKRSNGYFKMFNLTLTSLNEQYGVEILKSSLIDFYTGFIELFNSQYYKIPKISQLNLNWPNALNYRGLLGLLPSQRELYKKSSIQVGDSLQRSIEDMRKNTKELHGIIVSNFGDNPKKYGLVHTELELKDNFVRLYNWIEMFDYNGRLEYVSKCNNSNFFATTLKQPEFETEEGRLSVAIDFLNPINLTNNLVVLPLNYTMNTMISIGGLVVDRGSEYLGKGQDIQSIQDRQNNAIIEAASQNIETGQSPGNLSNRNSNNQDLNPLVNNIKNQTNATTTPEQTSWMSIPPVLKNLFSNQAAVVPEDSDSDLEEDLGKFLIGISDGTISRKLVYIEEENGFKEYQIVIFTREDIYITLVYDSAYSELDKPEFYERTQFQLNLLIDETQQGGTSGLGASTGSLRSLRTLNNMLQNQELDNEFFFVIHDPSDGSIQSSLPFLPATKSSSLVIKELSKSETANLKYQNAMFYLHDQLLSLFVVQNNRNFFVENGVNEYFHKFTSNKVNDWMFYYIQYSGKFIIIIKNGKKRQGATGGTARTTASAGSGAASTTGDGPLGSTRTYGFLDNLGEDVKYWLEGFSHSGET